MSLNITQQYDLVDEKPFKWDDEGNIILWIAPTSSKGYQDAMNAFSRWEQAQTAGFRRGIKSADIEEKRTEAMKKAAAEHLIRRWEGVTDEDTGEDVPYTPARGMELMNHSDTGDSFLLDVLAAATNTAVFRKERMEAAAKNSETLSGSGAESGSTPRMTAVSSSAS